MGQSPFAAPNLRRWIEVDALHEFAACCGVYARLQRCDRSPQRLMEVAAKLGGDGDGATWRE